jgi:hypothetical protein
MCNVLPAGCARRGAFVVCRFSDAGRPDLTPRHFAVFVKIAVVVFSHPIGMRDLSILFDDGGIFAVELRIIA